MRSAPSARGLAGVLEQPGGSRRLHLERLLVEPLAEGAALEQASSCAAALNYSPKPYARQARDPRKSASF